MEDDASLVNAQRCPLPQVILVDDKFNLFIGGIGDCDSSAFIRLCVHDRYYETAPPYVDLWIKESSLHPLECVNWDF